MADDPRYVAVPLVRDWHLKDRAYFYGEWFPYGPTIIEIWKHRGRVFLTGLLNTTSYAAFGWSSGGTGYPTDHIDIESLQQLCDPGAIPVGYRPGSAQKLKFARWNSFLLGEGPADSDPVEDPHWISATVYPDGSLTLDEPVSTIPGQSIGILMAGASWTITNNPEPIGGDDAPELSWTSLEPFLVTTATDPFQDTILWTPGDPAPEKARHEYVAHFRGRVSVASVGPNYYTANRLLRLEPPYGGYGTHIYQWVADESGWPWGFFMADGSGSDSVHVSRQPISTLFRMGNNNEAMDTDPKIFDVAPAVGSDSETIQQYTTRVFPRGDAVISDQPPFPAQPYETFPEPPWPPSTMNADRIIATFNLKTDEIPEGEEPVFGIIIGAGNTESEDDYGFYLLGQQHVDKDFYRDVIYRYHSAPQIPEDFGLAYGKSWGVPGWVPIMVSSELGKYRVHSDPPLPQFEGPFPPYRVQQTLEAGIEVAHSSALHDDAYDTKPWWWWTAVYFWFASNYFYYGDTGDMVDLEELVAIQRRFALEEPDPVLPAIKGNYGFGVICSDEAWAGMDLRLTSYHVHPDLSLEGDRVGGVGHDTLDLSNVTYPLRLPAANVTAGDRLSGIIRPEGA